VRERQAVILLLCAFILMMACTPFSLRSGKAKKEDEGAAVKQQQTQQTGSQKSMAPLPDVGVEIPQVDSLLLSEIPADSLLSDEVPKDSVQAALDVIREAVTDGDSLVRPASPTTVMREAAAKLKRDTTTMDSLELAIYKHNKAVDDSLALDSINRSRKSGIDSPVEYTANDSLTYDAIISQARLYGTSRVKYQNMDLASEKIFMSLDSNIVHAEGRLDSQPSRPSARQCSRWAAMSIRRVRCHLTSSRRRV